jgi:hypothetical protein
MPVANSYNLTTTRDGIITRALRIIGGVGQGETPPTAAVTEAAEALNDLVKEWQTDGMPLWCLHTYGPLTLVSGQKAYEIGIGATDLTTVAPLKLLQAWKRNNNIDNPLVIATREEYNLMSDKSSTGSPSIVWYNPPGNLSATENKGTLTVYVAPDSTAASNDTIYFTGTKPFADFDAADDVPDFPQYWYNALKWGLADQLAYEYGVGLAERSMISKKADKHKDKALEGGTEEGSLFFQPSDM